MTSSVAADCNNCHPQLRVQHCQACRGPCSRSVELNSRSPPDVKNLFSDPSDLIKPIIKTLDFQEKQKRSYLLSQSKRLAALDAKQKEILRQKKERIAAIEKAKLRLAQLHRDIAKKKEQLRNGAPSQEIGTASIILSLSQICARNFQMKTRIMTIIIISSKLQRSVRMRHTASMMVVSSS